MGVPGLKAAIERIRSNRNSLLRSLLGVGCYLFVTNTASLAVADIANFHLFGLPPHTSPPTTLAMPLSPLWHISDPHIAFEELAATLEEPR
jgi:hypothetical protein